MVRLALTLMLGITVLTPVRVPRNAGQGRGASAGVVTRPDSPVAKRGGTSRSGYIIASS